MQFIKRDYSALKSCKELILGADIGGTNSSFGLFGINKNRLSLISSFHFKSNEIKNFNDALKTLLDYTKEEYKIKISKACIAAAGALSPNKDYVKITNSGFHISRKDVLRCGIKKVILINDFEAVAYGIFMLKKNEIKTVKKAVKAAKAPILVIGAGTGMGKSLLLYDSKRESYVPIASEAGHMDFPAQTKEENDIANFIKKYRKTNRVAYEDFLSGRGLENIYYYLRKTKKSKYSKEIDSSSNKPVIISKHRKTDAVCKETFEIFTKVYAIFARNFALDCIPFGGVYIAGGIAFRNQDIFNSKFVKEFENSKTYKQVLKKIPVYLVKNANIGLLGAGFDASGIE
ncbi:MAG TPA: glucokinase [Candidatus Nanoarchaeia archaeon]|nr:glucokinase [Candidatus Nanoarchaeia archaeon]